MSLSSRFPTPFSVREEKEEEEEEEEGPYEVELVRGKRWNAKERQTEYLIKWVGYRKCTWESADNCDCEYLIDEFEATKKAERRAARLKVTREGRVSKRPHPPRHEITEQSSSAASSQLSSRRRQAQSDSPRKRRNEENDETYENIGNDHDYCDNISDKIPPQDDLQPVDRQDKPTSSGNKDLITGESTRSGASSQTQNISQPLLTEVHPTLDDEAAPPKEVSVVNISDDERDDDNASVATVPYCEDPTIIPISPSANRPSTQTPRFVCSSLVIHPPDCLGCVSVPLPSKLPTKPPTARKARARGSARSRRVARDGGGTVAAALFSARVDEIVSAVARGELPDDEPRGLDRSSSSLTITSMSSHGSHTVKEVETEEQNKFKKLKEMADTIMDRLNLNLLPPIRDSNAPHKMTEAEFHQFHKFIDNLEMQRVTLLEPARSTRPDGLPDVPPSSSSAMTPSLTSFLNEYFAGLEVRSGPEENVISIIRTAAPSALTEAEDTSDTAVDESNISVGDYLTSLMTPPPSKSRAEALKRLGETVDEVASKRTGPVVVQSNSDSDVDVEGMEGNEDEEIANRLRRRSRQPRITPTIPPLMEEINEDELEAERERILEKSNRSAEKRRGDSSGTADEGKEIPVAVTDNIHNVTHSALVPKSPSAKLLALTPNDLVKGTPAYNQEVSVILRQKKLSYAGSDARVRSLAGQNVTLQWTLGKTLEFNKTLISDKAKLEEALIKAQNEKRRFEDEVVRLNLRMVELSLTKEAENKLLREENERLHRRHNDDKAKAAELFSSINRPL